MDAKQVGVEAAPRQWRDQLLKAGEWKVCWRDVENEPRRILVQHRLRPKPAWAEHEWVPQSHVLVEDVACRAVMRVFVAQGFPVEQVDDALGSAVQAWADNPQRVAWTFGGTRKGGNELLDAYNAVRMHLSGGGRLRDVPVQTAELVYDVFGAQLWAHVVELEQKDFGPFPAEWRDLLGDTWAQGRPETPMPLLEREAGAVVH